MDERENELLDAAIDQALRGRLDYAGIMEALGRADAEGAEIYAVRAPLEELLPDGTPRMELLCMDGQLGKMWLCFSSKKHLEKLTEKTGRINTARMAIRTLRSMAEDFDIGGVVLNPETEPNLCFGREDLEEIGRQSDAYQQRKNNRRIQEAGRQRIPGWIL